MLRNGSRGGVAISLVGATRAIGLAGGRSFVPTARDTNARGSSGATSGASHAPVCSTPGSDRSRSTAATSLGVATKWTRARFARSSMGRSRERGSMRSPNPLAADTTATSVGHSRCFPYRPTGNALAMCSHPCGHAETSTPGRPIAPFSTPLSRRTDSTATTSRHSLPGRANEQFVERVDVIGRASRHRLRGDPRRGGVGAAGRDHTARTSTTSSGSSDRNHRSAWRCDARRARGRRKDVHGAGGGRA